jgi:hypothetical protein
MPPLHIVYRSYGPENRKDRPPYYNKLLALTSLVQAAEDAGAPVEIVFLNDGPIPEDRLAVMQTAGEVVSRSGLGLRRSWQAAVALPLKRRWPDEDLVWLCEDDYLYRDRSIRDLLAAADALPHADYLALYATIGRRPAEGGPLEDQYPVPARWQGSAPVSVNGHPWRRGLATTATFGVRMRTLRRDHRILSLTYYTGLGGCDHAACLLYQGLQPFRWRTLGRELLFGFRGSAVARAKRSVIAPVKAVFNVWSYGRAKRGSHLFSADPALATHLESQHLAEGTDWAAVARACAARAAEQGFAPTSPPG